MPHDHELAERIRACLSTLDLPADTISERRMFGGLAFLVDGKLAIAANRAGGVMARTDPATSAELCATYGVTEVEMRGRRMRGWLGFEAALVDTEEELRVWVQRSVAYARSLA